jgi:hypothetical protein
MIKSKKKSINKKTKKKKLKPSKSTKPHNPDYANRIT